MKTTMELSAQELRLGNYIEYAGVICEVEEIHKKTITTNGVNAPISSFLSIPLTKEWLFKFHPNALDLSNQIFRVGRFKLIWKFSYKYWYVVDDSSGAYMTKIEFVHEWQNFWHIMNGEELTINN